MMIDQLAEIPVEEAAQKLLGQYIVRVLSDGTQLSAQIVETEAYHESDPASHTYRGQTPRNTVMFGPAGKAYVYFTYGMHYCFNVTSSREGEGSAVLIRALEPLEGTNIMRRNRFQGATSETASRVARERVHQAEYSTELSRRDMRHLCSGPAKLTQALQIDRELNGHDLQQPPLQLVPGEEVNEPDIVTTSRIGISRATDTPWRFYIRSNPHVSKP